MTKIRLIACLPADLVGQGFFNAKETRVFVNVNHRWSLLTAKNKRSEDVSDLRSFYALAV
jgi:hypothetical protein